MWIQCLQSRVVHFKTKCSFFRLEMNITFLALVSNIIFLLISLGMNFLLYDQRHHILGCQVIKQFYLLLYVISCLLGIWTNTKKVSDKYVNGLLLTAQYTRHAVMTETLIAFIMSEQYHFFSLIINIVHFTNSESSTSF